MYRLVIVDDEEKIVEGIANLFPWEQIGFSVMFFNRAGKALEYMESHPVDVLMSDIEMPGIDGIELCRRIQDKDIKVIFISSYQNYEYFRYAIQFRVEDYLLKPIKSGDILTCFGKIREDLDRKYQVKEENNSSYYEQIVDKVKKYIEENYKEASLEEAAVLVNLSPNYLSKIFKDKCGTGFSEYLTKTRMEKACELLNDIQYKGYDIAYYIGYDNPKNFSRAFKAYFGMSPKEYRNGKNL
ncbi:MAG: response regulator [Hungatella sp.]|nr:response regulator [Hungatella sp.]